MEETGKACPATLNPTLVFDHVSFAYPSNPSNTPTSTSSITNSITTNPMVLQDISFTMPSGQVLAVLGEIGSGKSTLAQLISRLYSPQAGCISLGGLPIQDYDLTYLREQMGYVPQDSFLFSDTVANNIAYGLPQASIEQIKAVAKTVAVYDDITQFPQGFDTMVGERGIMLSGGQKQRIALARALIRRPKLLLLDDCLSAVDTKTEHAILSHLSTYFADSSVLIITHRLSAARLANQIIVLNQGRITEQGTHATLMTQQGYYARVYQEQLQVTT